MKYIEERWEFPSDRPTPASGTMQVLYEGDKVVGCEYLCPCGCGREIYTPTDGSRGWTYSPGPTINPSVRWLGGCKAHFFIRNGQVEFCEDSGR